MAKPTSIYLEYTCQEIQAEHWERLMSHKRKISYKYLINLIKKHEPSIYKGLFLELHNPWENETYSTPTHYILTHSAIEYFFRKVF